MFAIEMSLVRLVVAVTAVMVESLALKVAVEAAVAQSVNAAA